VKIKRSFEDVLNGGVSTLKMKRILFGNEEETWWNRVKVLSPRYSREPGNQETFDIQKGS